jgi:hypothetical protein
METPNKSGQHCPGPAKSSRTRVETLRDRREKLREEMRKASAQLADAEAKAERLARIEARAGELREREQLSECSKQAGLDRYRLPSDSNFPDAHPAMDIHLISAAIAWLSQKMSAMSEADLAAMREEGALRAEEVQKKRDAHEKRDAPEPAKARGEIERPLAFDLPE